MGVSPNDVGSFTLWREQFLNHEFTMTKKRLPDTYRCGNGACGRNLEMHKYQIPNRPPGSAEQEGKVHRQKMPDYWSFTLMCTCGHYTVVEQG
jgi:hypothetical protein